MKATQAWLAAREQQVKETNEAYAQELLEADDKRVADKWGAAGCIAIGSPRADRKDNEYLFFGWASS